jgi:hypothetical protein
VRFLIHFGSLGVTLLLFEQWEAVLKMARIVWGAFFIFFSSFVFFRKSKDNFGS